MNVIRPTKSDLLVEDIYKYLANRQNPTRAIKILTTVILLNLFDHEPQSPSGLEVRMFLIIGFAWLLSFNFADRWRNEQ